MPEPLTNEVFELLELRLDNIRAAMGVEATLDEMAKTGGSFGLIYIAMANWIRATQLASEVARAATALSGPQLEDVTVALHKHVELLRVALATAENLIAKGPGERS